MFQAVLSLGFCPDLLLKKPLCQWYSLQWKPGPQGKEYSFLPPDPPGALDRLAGGFRPGL
jgi:hypothetical protein